MSAQAPVAVSPFIKGARWGLLFVGITYGTLRQKMLMRQERMRLDELERTRPEREAREAAERKRKMEAELQEIENIISGKA